MQRPLALRTGKALALLAVVVPLAACGIGTTTLPASEAVTHYESLVGALGDALGDDGATWQQAPETRKVAGENGACLFTPGTWDPEAPLPAPDGHEGWTDRITSVNAVVEGYGFASIEDVTEQGSRSLLETADEHGATLLITAEGQIRIQQAAVDAAPCSPKSLGIG